jgi:hypothetical protein
MINNSLKKQNYTLFGSRYLNVDGLGVFKGVAAFARFLRDKKKGAECAPFCLRGD